MKDPFAFLMLVALFGTTFTVVSAQEHHKLHVTAHVVDAIGISADDIVEGAKKFFGKRGIEVVDEGGIPFHLLYIKGEVREPPRQEKVPESSGGLKPRDHKR